MIESLLEVHIQQCRFLDYGWMRESFGYSHLLFSLIGPEAFKRKGYYGDDGNPVSPFCIPPGARHDPFRPSSYYYNGFEIAPIQPVFPKGIPPPRKPYRPNLPPFSSPNPDHLPKPGFSDFY